MIGNGCLPAHSIAEVVPYSGGWMNAARKSRSEAHKLGENFQL